MKPSDRMSGVRWEMFALACATSWWLYLHRYAFGVLKPYLTQEWGVSKSELGALDALFMTFYTTCQFPLGVATDIGGVRLMLPLMIVIWSLGTGAVAWVPGAKWLWLTRVSAGLGQAAVYAGLSRISRQWFPPGSRTTLQGLVGVLSGRLGGLSANLVLTSLMLGLLGWNWRVAITVLALAGVGHAILFAWRFRESPAVHPGVTDAERRLIAGGDAPPGTPASSTTGLSVVALWGKLEPRGMLNLVALNVQTTLSTFADNVYSSWVPLFLSEVYKLDLVSSGVCAAMPMMGGALGGAIGGALDDCFFRLTGNRKWSRRGVAAVGKLLAAVMLLLAFVWYRDPWMFCGALFVVKLVGDWSVTTTWGVVADIGGPSTASVFSLNNAIASVGAIVASVVFGFIAQRYGWPAVFATVGVTYVACSVSWLLIDCTIPLFPATRNEPR